MPVSIYLGHLSSAIRRLRQITLTTSGVISPSTFIPRSSKVWSRTGHSRSVPLRQPLAAIWIWSLWKSVIHLPLSSRQSGHCAASPLWKGGIGTYLSDPCIAPCDSR